MSEPAINIRKLSPEERLRLLEQLWDSLSDDDVPLTPAQREELDRRLDELDREGPGGIPWEEVNENISRKMVVGNRVMMVMYRFRKRAEWPEEKHDAEQGGYMIKGRTLLRLPDGDKELVLGPGDGYLIESNKRHAWKYLDDEVVFIDFFSPPRFELLERKFAPKAETGSIKE